MGDTDDEPTLAELRIFAACDDGGFGSITAVKLVQVANVFDDFGCPLVTGFARCGHLTWTVAGVTATISLSDSGFWGVNVVDPKLPPLCDVGKFRNKASLLHFRALCMAAKGRMIAALVDLAEQMKPKRRRRGP